jgi:hypothetical protein
MAIAFLATGRTLTVYYSVRYFISEQEMTSIPSPLNSLVRKNSHGFNYRSCQSLVFPL